MDFTSSSSTLCIWGQKASWPVPRVAKAVSRACWTRCLLLPTSSISSCPSSHQALLRFERCGAVPGSREQEERAFLSCLCFQQPLIPVTGFPCGTTRSETTSRASALLCKPSGSGWVASLAVFFPTVGYKQCWDSDSKAEMSWRRWLCCHSGLPSRGWQCSWVRPRVCGLDEGVIKKALLPKEDLMTWPVSPRLSEPCYRCGKELGLEITSEVSWS